MARIGRSVCADLRFIREYSHFPRVAWGEGKWAGQSTAVLGTGVLLLIVGMGLSNGSAHSQVNVRPVPDASPAIPHGTYGRRASAAPKGDSLSRGTIEPMSDGQTSLDAASQPGTGSVGGVSGTIVESFTFTGGQDWTGTVSSTFHVSSVGLGGGSGYGVVHFVASGGYDCPGGSGTYIFDQYRNSSAYVSLTANSNGTFDLASFGEADWVQGYSPLYPACVPSIEYPSPGQQVYGGAWYFTGPSAMVVGRPYTVYGTAAGETVTITLNPTSWTAVHCRPQEPKVDKYVYCSSDVYGNFPSGSVSWSASPRNNITIPHPSCTLRPVTVAESRCTVSEITRASGNVTVRANYGGDVNNPASSGSFTLSVHSKPHRPRMNLTCPLTVLNLSNYAFLLNCTAHLGGSVGSPTGMVAWNLTNSSGGLSANTCTLFEGNCSVEYFHSGALTSSPTIVATYWGNALYSSVSRAYTMAGVSQGATQADQSDTSGAIVTVSGATGSWLNISSTDWEDQPNGTGTAPFASADFFEVTANGSSQGTAAVCYLFPDVNASTSMDYFANGAWSAVPGALAVPGLSICGSLSLALLPGTFFIVSAPTIPSSSTPVLSGVTLIPAASNLSTGSTAEFTAALECGGSPCPAGTVYSWTLSNGQLGSLNSTTGQTVMFSAGTATGTGELTVIAMLNGVSRSANATLTILKGGGASSSKGFLGLPDSEGYVLVGVLVVAAVSVLVLLRRKARPVAPSAKGEQKGVEPSEEKDGPPPAKVAQEESQKAELGETNDDASPAKGVAEEPPRGGEGAEKE